MGCAILLTDCEGLQEPTIPNRIRAGSFATVFAASPGRPTVAIKGRSRTRPRRASRMGKFRRTLPCESARTSTPLPRSAELPLPLRLLCRLYFGKELRPSTFVNPSDLLRDGDDDITPKDEVAMGMGEMLAVIHWQAGHDAWDVEFVMAGAPDSAAVRLYVIDFNQGDVSELVDTFFANDPYYPCPVPGDPPYDSFKQVHRERATLFLQVIQACHSPT
ncbi:hypothetical protein LXA43DRAFT_1101430 [Ganoderma leucocontextum]|nr:hypothetical protein LXA43DRAFT_1101430 [Ganoderma leucocontextum]